MHRFTGGGIAVGGDDFRAGIDVAPVDLVNQVRTVGERAGAPHPVIRAGLQTHELGPAGPPRITGPLAESRSSIHRTAAIGISSSRIIGSHHHWGKAHCQPRQVTSNSNSKISKEV